MPRSRRIDPDLVVDDESVEETDEETTPAPRRRTRSADSEEAPVRRRRRPADEEEEDDADEEEALAPVARRRRSTPAEEEAPMTRRRSRADSSDDDDADDDDAVIPISRGRKEIKKNRPSSEASLAYFRWDEEPQLIKFLDNEPWSYDQHWITRDGKQSFPCLGKGCPLCAIGVKASQKIVYPILNLSPVKGEDFLSQTLEVGTQLDETLSTHDSSTKTGPLTRLWWSVSRTEISTGKRKKYNYVFTPVKDRDLEEDWDIDPDDADAAADAAKIATPEEVLGKWNRAQLQEIADEAMGHA